MRENVVDMDKKKEEKKKKGFNFNYSKIAVTAVVLGTVYLVGASRGFEVGFKRGELQGYTKATGDIANLIRRSAR